MTASPGWHQDREKPSLADLSSCNRGTVFLCMWPRSLSPHGRPLCLGCPPPSLSFAPAHLQTFLGVAIAPFRLLSASGLQPHPSLPPPGGALVPPSRHFFLSPNRGGRLAAAPLTRRKGRGRGLLTQPRLQAFPFRLRHVAGRPRDAAP